MDPTSALCDSCNPLNTSKFEQTQVESFCLTPIPSKWKGLSVRSSNIPCAYGWAFFSVLLKAFSYYDVIVTSYKDVSLLIPT